MKLRTRKFLAGLLSVGMLLQAASPLSALAAEDAPAAAHKLTVTVGSTDYTLTSDGTNVTTPENWSSNYPTVSYDDGFVFTGGFNDSIVLDGSENVTIKGASYAVNGSLNATVNDLTVTKSNSGTAAAIRGAATITSAGDVRISGNLDYSDIHLVNQAVQGKLTVYSAQDVSIDGILNGGANITCQTLSLNCGNGSTVRGTLTVKNAEKIQATAYAIYGVIGDRDAEGNLVLDNCTGAVTLCNTYGYKAVQAGTVKVENLPDGYVARYYAGYSEAESTETEDADDCAKYSYFRIEYVNPSNKTLTLVNAKAYKDAEYTTELINATSVNGTSTYHVDEGKTVYVKAEKPDEVSQWKFNGWTGSDETDEEITVTVSEDMTLTANWAERITHILTLTHAKAYNGEDELNGTTEGDTTTYEVEDGKELIIKAVAPDKDNQWKFNGWTGSDETGEEIPVTVTGDMTLTANWVERTAYTLTLTNAKAYTNDTYETPLEPTTEGGNEYSVEAGEKVYLKTEKPGEEARWECYWYSKTNLLNLGVDKDDLYNETISFKMPAENMELEVKWYKLYYITANNEPYVFTDGTSNVANGWAIALSCKKVAGYDQDTGYSAILWEKDEGSADFEFVDNTSETDWFPHIRVTSEGDVKLKVTFTESGYYKVTLDSNCTLVNVDEDHGQYYQTNETVTVKVTEPADENQKLDKITVTLKKDGSTIIPEKDADGNYTFTMPNSPVTVTASWKDGNGDDVPTDDTTVTTDPGSTAGGAVAAVVVGGAAILGGYEITTRVILHNILPEGAAIPANRGQLALLIWNNADRPEPANEPAFADVADADMAKAAQWCVEQGIMDAKTEDTFKPEGWTPKFKVIETWNKAFPAAK